MSSAIALVSVAAGDAVFVAAVSLDSVLEPHAASAAVTPRTVSACNFIIVSFRGASWSGVKGSPPQTQIGGGADEHGEQRCGQHPADHGRPSTAHNFRAPPNSHQGRTEATTITKHQPRDRKECGS